MSILAIVGVIVSSAAMFVVLSGFSGLKDYSLEFISFVSPELKITSAKGKSFEFTEKIRSFLEDENISPVIKDVSESARLAGFGIITDFNQEVFIHSDQLSMANRILKNYLDNKR